MREGDEAAQIERAKETIALLFDILKRLAAIEQHLGMKEGK